MGPHQAQPAHHHRAPRRRMGVGMDRVCRHGAGFTAITRRRLESRLRLSVGRRPRPDQAVAILLVAEGHRRAVWLGRRGDALVSWAHLREADINVTGKSLD